MTLFDRHERCVGIRLWQGKRTFIQLWMCPPGYKVKPHSHNDESIELIYVLGRTTFFRLDCGDREESFTPRLTDVFRKFTVRAGQVHWFEVSTWPLLFINVATFREGVRPTSAAIDFHEKEY